MKINYTLSVVLCAIALLTSNADLNSQCSVNCGTGSNGVYLATANTTLASGTYNYTSFTINSGVTVTVTGTQPLIIYCSGNVLINGALSADGGLGGDGVTFSTFGVGGIGTAGGANGGNGVYLGSAAPGQNGFGLGAGTGGGGWSGGGGSGFSGVGANSGGGGGLGGPAYGTANLSPLYGGSGGGGGSGGNSCGSGGGGGGGGIISIQACGTITIGATGQVHANGGNGGSDGGGNCGSGAGGSGGSIWFATSGTITNNGLVTANGGVGGASTIFGPPYYGIGGTGSNGRIRCDYSVLNGSGTYSPVIGYTGTLLGVAMSSTNVSCFGGNNGTATANVTGGSAPYTYAWSPSGGNAATATGLAPGIYTCTVTDFVGCVSTTTVNVTAPTPITAGVSSVGVSCFGGNNGTATVSGVSGGTGSYTYSWSPSGGTAASANSLTSGNYTCTITDANGCINTQTVSVTQPASALTASTSVVQNLCNGQCAGTATATPSGGTAPYTFTNLTSLCAGNYTMTITDSHGCTTSPTVSIVDPTLLSATFTTIAPTCNGDCNGSATVTPSGGTPGYTYLWSPIASTQATITGLCVGSYTCMVTDANGCTTSIAVTITEPTLLMSVVDSSSNPSCFGLMDGYYSVSATGGVGPYSGTGLFSNVGAGTIVVVISDANGCTAQANIVISDPPQIVTTVAQNNSPSCYGGCNGAATVLASGGTGTLTWMWTPSGCTSQSCVGLCAGNYSVVITDANGCNATVNFDITQPSLLAATVTHTNESIASANDGTATVTPSGGTPGYTYSWAPSGGTAATATGLDAGTYTCTITDANGCITTVTVTITTIDGVGIAAITDPNFSVNLFPNPAEDHVQVAVTTAQKGDVILEVYNLIGEKLEVINFGNVSSVNQSYNTSTLANGIYFFRVSSGNQTITKRITVSH